VAIFQRLGVRLSTWVTLASIALGFLASGLTPRDVQALSGISIVCTAGAVVLIGALVFYSRGKNTSGVAVAAGGTLVAFVYIGLMGGFLLALRKEHSAWLMLGILLVTKSCDIGAYFTGRLIGRHKLIPWLSPKKTWEGLFGGVIASTAVGAVAVWAAGDTIAMVTPSLALAPWQGAVAGLIFGVVGQGGDLVASLLKRDAGLKDASQVVPGFGGILDVIDSPLAVAPVAYWLFLAMVRAQ
jgi:phosphatidate cytidylyltransferase